jgi:hypothetical protein
MDVEQLRKDIHAGRITRDRPIDLIVALHRRVLDTVLALTEADGDDLWPCLVGHIDDQRYAITVVDIGTPTNVSVEEICYLMDRDDLVFARNRYRNILPWEDMHRRNR